MLQLKNITKDYLSGEETVHALKGLSLNFRENEFVSILGQSGCGKTTLLNIVGGLDRYTSGDLIINGKSTKEYKDRDWDTYRNHSIGFVFQSYNLIPHQTVLSNVELALTLSGVSKAERRKRAKEALEKVGLGDQLRKKPNQMSGGQMQRVAIARALVNNPDILLADEPTGALDSETSLQVMEILKEVAKDKLVIMVTHNPDLAERYSTRIIRLLDGEVISDTMPFDGVEEEKPQEKPQKMPSMSFGTAFALSLNNLMTKKGRTILTAFAGSIGIIGIALILSLSSGVQDYIDSLEEDTLTSYPITIEQASMDMTSMMTTMMGTSLEEHEPGAIYSGDIMTGVMDAVLNEITSNDLSGFKAYLEAGNNEISDLCSEVSYTYDTQVGVYTFNVAGEVQQVNPANLLADIGLGALTSGMESMSSMGGGMGAMMSSRMDVFHELVDNQDMIESDYELLSGDWPSNYNEVVLVVTENYEIADYSLYCLGLLDQEELADAFMEAGTQMSESGEIEINIDQAKAQYSYEELMAMDLRLVLPTDTYAKDEDGNWVDMSDDEEFMEELVANAEPLKVVGVVRSTTMSSMEYGTIGYTTALTDYVITSVEGSDIVREQKADPDTDVFTGLPFKGTEAAEAIEAEEEAAKAEAQAAGETVEAQGYSQAQQDMIAAAMAMIPEQFAAQFEALSQEEQLAAMVENGLIDQAAFDALAESSDTASAAAGLSQAQKALLEETIALIPAEYSAQLTALPEEQQVQALIENGLLNQEDFDALAETGEEGTAAVTQKEKRISDSTYDENIALMHYCTLEEPSTISLYCASFEDKEALTAALDAYNDAQTEAGHEEKVIRYTDYVGLLMSSVTDIVDIISYVLIAFVGISLVVSSIMIGVITLISVQERTKEIGILRSIGASKRDISHVFNAETLIVGLCAGLFGIGLTILINIPANFIIEHLTGVETLCKLPPVGGAVLVVISVVLTMIAGLIPSKTAARKDPVEALRTE